MTSAELVRGRQIGGLVAASKPFSWPMARMWQSAPWSMLQDGGVTEVVALRVCKGV